MSGVDIAIAVLGFEVLVATFINCWMVQRIRRDLQEMRRGLQEVHQDLWEIHQDLRETNERLENACKAMLLLAVIVRQRQIESGQNPQLPGVCEKGRKEVNNELQGIPEGQTERDSTVGTGEARG